MSDREKVNWLKALIIIWTPGFLILILGVLGSPAAAIQTFSVILFWVFASPTALYLLTFSWRAAYVSGRSNG